MSKFIKSRFKIYTFVKSHRYETDMYLKILNLISIFKESCLFPKTLHSPIPEGVNYPIVCVIVFLGAHTNIIPRGLYWNNYAGS